MQRFTSSTTPKPSKRTQLQPLPGQVRNNAGGGAWALDKWAMAHRFLILGTEGGSYYASERKMSADNARNLIACRDEDPARLVKLIVDISDSGRAPKNDPALFALALVSACEDPEKKVLCNQLVEEALPKVARIGTHLFHFASYVNDLRGWGRGLQRAVEAWYNTKTPNQLADQLTKYQSRDGWSHRDVLRLAHPNPKAAGTPESHDHMYKLAVGSVEKDEDVPAWVRQGRMHGLKPSSKKYGDGGLYPKQTAEEIVQAWQKLGAIRSMRADMPVAAAVSLISNYKLPREVVPTELLTKPEVWEALLPHMGITALIRNLANLTKHGIIAPLNPRAWEIAARLTDVETLKRGRVHPIQVIAALMTYGSGHSARGESTWTPVPTIIDALDEAFYLAFQAIEPAGKRFVLGLDVSGSMDGGEIAGVPGLTPRIGTAVMAMVTMRTEVAHYTLGFSHRFIDLGLSPKMRLDQVMQKISGLPFAATDCAIPMRWALHEKVEADTFVVYTDNETWAGSVHPSIALQKYRQEMGIPARLVVVGMTSTGFSIADPNDAGMLDVVGFDTAAPQVISQFAAEKF